MHTNIPIVVVDQMADIVALINGHNDEIGKTINNSQKRSPSSCYVVSSQVILHDHSALHGFTSLAI